ncbi:uncharacterized protein LOC126379252 [Pectinophora gossypiella]|uniref:uncharacterized protein LOC126379252 n=1 Tax=Pectinophora gossypiella TaxID=13191 RepID=UPI00214EEF59|nr:uncharacterized protein LOC126379252 [Pectinophora gossypiella]
MSLHWHYIRLQIRQKRFQLNEKLEALKMQEIPQYKETRSPAYYKELRADNTVYNWYLVGKCALAAIAFIILMTHYTYNYYINSIHRHSPLRLGFIALFCILLLLLLLHSRDYELLMKRIDWQTIVIFLSLGVITSVFTTLTAHMDDYLWKLYGTTMTGSRKRKVHKVFAQMLSYCSVTGIANEYTISKFFLDTVLTFSVFRGLDAIGEIMGGFMMATGFWGTATILGTGANLLIAGLSETNGYQMRFIKHMRYGLPFALMSIILLYIFISTKYLL